MATLICLPLTHEFAHNTPIRAFSPDMWLWHSYWKASAHWYIIAKGNRIEGIEARE